MAFSAEQMIVLAVVFSTLAVITVGLRFWARRLTRARYGLDDLLILPAMVKFSLLPLILSAGHTLTEYSSQP